MALDLLNPAHYHYNWLTIPALLTASLTLVLGLVVLARERHSRVSAAFFVMTASATIWLFSYALIYAAATPRVAQTWAFFGQVGVLFIPAAVYHFTIVSLHIYRQHRSRTWLMWCVSSAFLLALVGGNAHLGGLYSYPWGYYPRYDWIGRLFIAYFIVQMALSLHHYWASYRAAATDIGRSRNLGLFTAFCVAYFGSIDFLPAVGINVYPVGCFGVLGFLLLVDRTIKRYHLLNITPAFAAREIIDAMDDALLILDDEGIVRVANRSACRLFAGAGARIEGASVSAVADALAFSDDEEFTRKLLNGSFRDHECSMPGNGPVVHLSSFAMRDPANNPLATVCLLRDVSEQKKARELIQRHNDRQAALYEFNLAATSTLELRSVLEVLLARLADVAPDRAATIALVDDGGQLRKVACRGVDEQLWLSKPYNAENPPLTALENRDGVYVRDLGSENGVGEASFFLCRGFRYYLGFPLIAKDKVAGILSFYSKKDRRYDDEEVAFLRALAQQAAIAIHNSQLYEQTRRQAIQLKKANQVKENFLSVMSHELRTPLNVISGYTKLVQEGVMGSVTPEQDKALDKVIHHANELLFMVNSIMDATKIEAGPIAVEREEFFLTDLFDELKFLYDYPLGKDVVLEWDCPADLPLMLSDRDKLKHILQNLINNALKFTDQGWVRVGARHRPDKDLVELTVADNGIGIAGDQIAHIFDRFRQLDSSRTRGYGGVGLGLHIVKTFTELLGGSVTVQSAPGQGSVFKVALPCICHKAGLADHATES